MAVPKFVFLLFFVAPHSVTSNNSSNLLGQGIEMRKRNIVSDMSQSGATIFAHLPGNCVNRQDSYQTSNTFAYYENTKSFYRKIGTTAGVSATLQSDYTLGFTLDSTTNSISGSKRTVKGDSLEIMAASSQDILVKSCLYNQPLDPRLVQDLHNLPSVIKEPWKSSSWQEYDVFLTKYGSHVASVVGFGSRITQTSFSESSYSYTQNDFEVKSCISLMGPTEAGMANVSLCAGVTQQQIEEVSEYSMSGSLVITGGNPETRNKLLYERTAPLITQFMNEANYTRSPIYYMYSPIWELIQGHGNSSHDDFIKAVNMEQYYNGYLSFGCNLIQAAGMNLQQFEVSPQSSPNTPRYQCTLQAEGCHSDDSCHYRLVKCKCEGGTCVRYKEATGDAGLIKDVPYINEADKWYWHGCGWKVWGSKCKCSSDNKTRFVAWSGDNKGDLSSDATRSAGTEKKAFEDKEEL